jgi:outer membrane murein-binding lipoprotein Lpp
MKKLVLFALVAVVFASCSNSGSTEATETSTDSLSASQDTVKVDSLKVDISAVDSAK